MSRAPGGAARGEGGGGAGGEIGNAAGGEVGAALGTSLLFDVFSLNQAVFRLLAETMRDGPLTPAEYAVYSAIFELEAATPTQLATRLGMRLTTFMDQLRELDRRGHARRLAHPTDGRSYRVVLSSEGRSVHRAANRLFERAYAAFATELGDEEAARAALASVQAAALRARSALAAVGGGAAAQLAGVRASAQAGLAMEAGASPRRSVGRAG